MLSVAVTVIVLAPEARVMLATVQAALAPCAVPEDPALTVHVTVIVPLPPVTEPESAIAGAPVVAAGAFTTSVMGTYAGREGGGVAGGAGAVGAGVVTGTAVWAS